MSRFIATIPMLIALVSIVVFGSLAVTECLWLGILCALNTLVFATCSHFYEDTVDAVQEFLVRMAKDIIKELEA